MEKILTILNETEFSLTSLVLQNNIDYNRDYDYRSHDESINPDLSEFFLKHCSDLNSLKLTNWLNPKHDRYHDLLQIASRTVSSSCSKMGRGSAEFGRDPAASPRLRWGPH